MLALSLLFINTYTSTASALTLTLAIALSAITLSLKLAQKVFSSGLCALCTCCPGTVWPQRSHDGGVFLHVFVKNLWILLGTTSTCKSLWRLLFLMYQGALTMCLSTLLWNHCIMSILLCLVQPHSWIPYVQMGFKICLYKRSFL